MHSPCIWTHLAWSMKNASALSAQIKLKKYRKLSHTHLFSYASVATASGKEFENSSTSVWNLQTASHLGWNLICFISSGGDQTFQFIYSNSLNSN